jgi:AraC family ethanolamine operon transcriptional activator
VKLIIDLSFNHQEQFAEQVKYWDFDFRLLGLGGFKASVKQLLSDKIIIGYARCYRRLDQVGAAPSGYKTFLLCGQNCNGFRWRHHQVNQNDLLIYPGSNEWNCFSYDDFEVFSISIDFEYFEQIINNFDLSTISKKKEIVHLNASTANSLRHLATTIFQSTDSNIRHLLSVELAQQLVLSCEEDDTKRIIRHRRRDIAVKTVVDFIKNSTIPTHDMAQLCRIANVSERTLQYAFREHYGLGPMAFVKRWNLNRARYQLLNADSGELSISQTSMDLNFTHQSQFAADYKKLFSESPSETLKRVT